MRKTERQPPIDPEFLDPETGEGYLKIMKARWGKLSIREKQIAKLTSDGKTTKEIAVLLKMSEPLVKSDKINAHKILGIDKQAQLVRLHTLIQEGRIDPSMPDGREDTLS